MSIFNRTLLFEAMKFCIVGILNTGLTLAIIFLMWKKLGAPEYLSNWIGYITGFINSFLLNKKWTFKSRNNFKSELLRFSIVFALCYTIQLSTLYFLETVPKIASEYAQLIAMICYTGFNFLLNKIITFKKTIGHLS